MLGLESLLGRHDSFFASASSVWHTGLWLKELGLLIMTGPWDWMPESASQVVFLLILGSLCGFVLLLIDFG